MRETIDELVAVDKIVGESPPMRRVMELVEHVASLPETHPDTLAFCLMMIRLNSCLNCVSGSYRFMRGCELCSQQTIARYQGTDEELLEQYERAKYDLTHYADGAVELVADVPEPESPE